MSMDLGALPTPADVAELSGADLDQAIVELEQYRTIALPAPIAADVAADLHAAYRD